MRTLAKATEFDLSRAGLAESNSNVVVKINVLPFTEDGWPCQATAMFIDFKGTRVSLKNCEGQIRGVGNVNGWNCDPSIDSEPAACAYIHGDLCAYDITYSGVDTSWGFYALEFSANVEDVTLSKNVVVPSPEVFLYYLDRVH